MADFVHARRRDGKIVFRVWNTIVDRYENPEPLDRAAIREYLLGQGGESLVRQKADAALAGAIGLLSGIEGVRVHLPGASDAAEVEARLDRAERNGTSSMMGDKDDLDGAWDTEMCRCGAFHHAYRLKTNGLCGHCGEPEGDRGHRPACVAA